MAAHQAPVPGILQARILEWVAISFSSAWKWRVKVRSLSHVRLFVTPWTVAYQAPLSMGFPRQEYCSGVPLPSPPSQVYSLSKIGVLKSPIITVIVHFFLQFYQFLLHVFQGSGFRYICVYSYYLPDGFFLSLRKCPLFIIPFLSYILSHLIWIQPLHLFYISVCLAYFPHFFTFKLFTSLNLKCVFCTQCIVRLWFLEIYSANLCLLIGGVIPFTLSVVQIIYNLLWFYCLFSICLMASLVAQTVKIPPAIQETWAQSLGGEDPLEKGVATHSSILAWRIPWAEETGGYSPWGCKESDTTE